MKTLKIFLILTISLIVCISNVYAYNFGPNITIYDNRSNPSGGDDGVGYTTPQEHGWWTTGKNIAGEDQEVEPGMWPLQKWDLEGFFLKDERYLSMVGGFDFQNGVKDGDHTFTSGDIFFDIDGNAQYGRSSIDTNVLNYGYDYVVHFTSWGTTSGTYDVFRLTNNSILADVYSYNFPMSNPWRYAGYRGTVADHKVVSGSFAYESGLTDAETGFLGDTVLGVGTHYAVEGIDLLSFLPEGQPFIAHFTMECGNDNLMDGGQTVPEPATMLLLGLGLIGVAAVRRKL